MREQQVLRPDLQQLVTDTWNVMYPDLAEDDILLPALVPAPLLPRDHYDPEGGVILLSGDVGRAALDRERVNGRVRKLRREWALSEPELARWPRSTPDYLRALEEAAA